ncbi:MarR family winged helix-turn-helix transcriptional regulator [Runella aurantiaca]|uniref:MarR family transcriptional regulator n=1 Tax=Runella aurantiaca TaxID=2282308 RepID=A0A369I6P5_9BACT|nr:MarR family transcriptional regulator [Runella aurantiaca]RDB03173.1 MarR family transcriptional regulator [Runella aurantiaca]
MITNEQQSIKEKIWGQLGQYLTFNINHVSHLFARKVNRELSKSGFTLQIEQFPILFLVNHSTEGLLSQQDIANFLQRDKSGIQRSIRTLERDGYVRIVSDDTDRRKNLIQLTPAGKFTIDKITEMAVTLNQEISSQLTPEEVSALLSILRKISATIDN